MDGSSRITELLRQWQDGNVAARDELFELVYRELRKIASARLRNEMRPHTLQATELVHEIYPQLARQRATWQNRSQFYALASECMRRYLVDYARTRTRQKRGGNNFRVSFADLKPSEICRIETNDEILAVDRALAKLAERDETAAAIIKHRYFGGLNREQIAEILAVSTATIDRAYRLAKAWLKRELAFEFSPYLLNPAEIKNSPKFIRRLQARNDSQIKRWREILPAGLLNKIDSTNVESETVKYLLPEIIVEINKYLLGVLNDAENKVENSDSNKTEMLPETQIKSERRRLEITFIECFE